MQVLGLGSDGTVGANKNSIKIIGDNTDMYAQGYFAYDSKKSGGVTISHLRFGKKKIKSTYYISKADFVACHNPSYVDKYDMVEDLKPGGTFLLNCDWEARSFPSAAGQDEALHCQERHQVLHHRRDPHRQGAWPGRRINTILQAAFFKLAKIIPADTAVTLMKDAATRSYGKKGEKVVALNHAAIERRH